MQCRVARECGRREVHRRLLNWLASTCLVILGTVSCLDIAAAGPLFFDSFQTIPTGAAPYFVTVRDVNGDGIPDLIATTHTPSASVAVMLGNGDGTFQPKASYATGSRSYCAAIGDLSGDGNPDLVVASHETNAVSVLLGNGDGTFGFSTDFAIGGASRSIAIGDVNGDGKLDVVTLNPYPATSVSVLLGHGDGTFAPKVDFPAGFNPGSVAISDLDGDGNLDLVVLDWGNHFALTYMGQGDGSFVGDGVRYATGNYPFFEVIADVNEDGKPDLVVANECGCYSPSAVSVLLGRGDGTFAPRLDLGVGFSPTSVGVGDLDSDGHVDIVAANSGHSDGSSNTLSVLQGFGDGTFASKQDFVTQYNPYSVAIDDLNRDGHPDLVAANGTYGQLSVLMNAIAPVAGVSPDTLRLTAATGDSTSGLVTLRNTGHGPLTYTIAAVTGTPAWLSSASSGGSLAPGDSTTFSVHARSDSLYSVAYPAAIQVFLGSIRVSSNDLVHPLLQVPVRFDVTPRPGIALSVDMRRMQRLRLFRPESGMRPVLQVTGGPARVMADVDGDSIWTARFEKRSLPAQIQYVFAIDPDGSGTNLGGEWVFERGGPGFPRTVDVDPSGESVLPAVPFDDLPLASVESGFQAVGTLSLHAGETGAFAMDSAASRTYAWLLPSTLDQASLASVRRYTWGAGGSPPAGIAIVAGNVYWGFDMSPATSRLAGQARFEYDAVSGITDPSALRVLGRGDASQPWQALPTTVDINARSLTVPISGSFGASRTQWTLGSVSTANPLLPSAPNLLSGPIPADSSNNVSGLPKLAWLPSVDAYEYELRVWLATDPRPSAPIASGLRNTSYQTFASLSFGRTYHWQVIARNAYGATEGPVWTFTTVAPPDLVPSAIQVPSDAHSGQSIQVAWTIENSGGTGTGINSWQDAVYLSPIASLVPGVSVLLGKMPYLTALEPGASYTNAAVFTLPQGISGSYHVIVVTNSEHSVPQEDTSNDQTSMAFNVTLTPPPDLQVVSLVVPDQAFSDEDVLVLWQVRNTGTGGTGAGSWFDSISLEPDSVGGSIHGQVLATLAHDGALASDSAYSVSATVRVPHAIHGRWRLKITTDAGNGIYEYLHEDNNARSDSIQVILSPPADLVVSSISAPRTGASGKPLTVGWTVTNAGAGPATETRWSDRIYLSTSPSLVPDSSVALATLAHAGALAADSSYLASSTVALPNGIAGRYYLFVSCDIDNHVFENGADVNYSVADTIDITLSPWADLLVSSVAVPDSSRAGEGITVRWEVANVGTALATGPWADYLYVAPAVGWDPTALQFLGRFQRDLTLAAGRTYAQSASVRLPATLATGDWRVYVKTDADNVVYEHTGESNNLTGSSSLMVRAVPLPDLVVEGLTASDSAASGQPYPVQWSVRNSGPSIASGSQWSDRVYLSADTTFNATTALLLTSVVRSDPVPAGASYSRDVIAAIPNGMSGAFHLFVVANADSVLLESTRDNNVAALPTGVAIRLTPPCDLQVSALQVPLHGNPGQPLDLEWTVENRGGGPTPSASWFDAVYLSQSPTLDGSELRLGYVQRGGGLAAGEAYTASLRVDVPPSVRPGTSYLLVKTDSKGEVYEQDAEGNNFAESAVQLTVPEPSDLVVSEVAIPSTASAGDEIPISWVVRNVGEVPASGYLRDAVYLSADSLWDVSDPLLGTRDGYVNLPPSASTVAFSRVNLRHLFSADSLGNITGELPGVPPGAYRVIVRTNVRNNIPETNITNNAQASSGSVDLNVPVLALDTPTPGRLENKRSQYYKVDVTAGQTLVVTLHGLATSGASELYVKYGTPPTRSDHDAAGAAPLQVDQELQVPATQAGTYYVLAFGDHYVDGETAFEITATVPGFEVRNLDVTMGGAGGKVTTRIVGAQFSPQMRVLLERPGGSVLDTARVFFENQASVLATFDLHAVPIGRYDVVLDRSGTYYVYSGDSVGYYPPRDTTLRAYAPTQFEVREPVGGLERWTSLPAAVRPGSNFSATLVCVNHSLNDVPSPVLLLHASPGASLQLPGNSAPTSGLQKLIVASPGGNGLSLRPGEVGTAVMLGVAPKRVRSLRITVVPAEESSASPDLYADLLDLGVDNRFPSGDAVARKLAEGVGGSWSAYRDLLVTEAERRRWMHQEMGSVKDLLFGVCQRVSDGDGTAATREAVRRESALDVSTACDTPLPDMSGSCVFLGETMRPYGLGIAAFLTVTGAWVGGGYLSELLGVPMGTDHDWRENSTVANYVHNGTVYPPQGAEVRRLARAAIESELDQDTPDGWHTSPFAWYNGTMHFSDEPHTPVFGAQGWDLATAFGGVTARAAIQQCYVTRKTQCGHTLLQYDADIVVRICDRYQWSQENARQVAFGGRFAGHEVTVGTILRNAQLCNRDVYNRSGPEYGTFRTSIELHEFVRGEKDVGYDEAEDDCKPPTVLPPDAPCELPSCGEVPVVTPRDPNLITGPAGTGDRRWVGAGQTLPYEVEFENDSLRANAPAQAVTITVDLDSTIDVRSFRLGRFGFGGRVVEVPEGVASFVQRVDARDSLGLYVDVTAGIDVNTRRAFWSFHSVDPATGDVPTSATVGFLPVNDARGRGLGFVTYRVRPEAATTTGTVVSAQARIVFDRNEPLDTDRATNTVDGAAPTSRVRVVALTDSVTAQLAWSRSDDANGAGVSYCTLYAATDDGPFQVFRTGLTDTTFVFTGDRGHAYRFFTLATDSAGNAESMKRLAEASVDLGRAPLVTQVRQLGAGWSTISSFVAPAESSIDSVMDGIAPGLVLVKNAAGQVYWPALGIKQFNNWDFRQGYQVYLSEPETLSTTGRPVVPEDAPITLAAAWNQIGYLRSSPMSADSALACIASHLVLAKNGSGELYWPALGINTLGALVPGQGYKVYVTHPDILTYPPNAGGMPHISLAPQTPAPSTASASPVSHHYLPCTFNTGSNASLLVESDGLNPGDEVAVRTADGQLAGAGISLGKRCLLTICGDDVVTPSFIEGAVEGESLVVVTWSALKACELPLIPGTITDGLTGAPIAGGLRYRSDAVWRLTADAIPTRFALSTVAPNPFRDETTIRYAVPMESWVRLEIFDVTGRQVALLVNEKQRAGFHSATFVGQGRASGVYFCRFRVPGFNAVKRIVLIR